MDQQEFLSRVILHPTDKLLFTKDNYKYQARSYAVYRTAVYPRENIITDLVVLRTDGWLYVSKYFAWDGASGPTWDDSTNMRASQGHDALYMLMRLGLLDPAWRPAADNFLRDQMIKDGAWRFRADYYRWAVDNFAAKHADPKSQKKVYSTP